MTKFYEFAQPTAPHPTRSYACQLPPEQHSWMGWTNYVQGHLWPTHDNTVPATYGPRTACDLLSDQNSHCRRPRRSSTRSNWSANILGTASHRESRTGDHRRDLQARKKLLKSYINIRRAVFNCLDDGIDDAFKVSNDPALTGWNASMEPREMFDQITATYGRPTPAALLQNDTFFRSL